MSVIGPPVTLTLTLTGGVQVIVTAPDAGSVLTCRVEAWPPTVHGEPFSAARLEGPAGPAAPVLPAAPFAPAGPCWFQEIAVLPFGQAVPASCSTTTCEPFTSWLV